jgi:hypothetical protein
MGWSLMLGTLFILILFVGIIIGLAYPIYIAFFSNEATQGKIPNEAKSSFVLALASLTNTFRFGGLSIIAFFVLAFLCSIFFTIFAILRTAFT